MKPVLFRGARIWDGSGAAAFPGDVLVEGTRIKAIAPAPERDCQQRNDRARRHCHNQPQHRPT